MVALKCLAALMAILSLASMVQGSGGYLFTRDKCYRLKDFNFSPQEHKAVGTEMVVYNSHGLLSSSSLNKSGAGDSTAESDFDELDVEESMEKQSLTIDEPVKRKCCSIKTILAALSTALLGLSSLLLVMLPCLFALSFHYESDDADDVVEQKAEVWTVAALEELMAKIEAEQNTVEEELSDKLMEKVETEQDTAEEQKELSEESSQESEEEWVELTDETLAKIRIARAKSKNKENEKAMVEETIVLGDLIDMLEAEGALSESKLSSESELSSELESSTDLEFDQQELPADPLNETEVEPAFSLGEFLKQLRFEAAKPVEDLLETKEEESPEAEPVESPEEPVKDTKPKKMKKRNQRALKKQRLAIESTGQTESHV